MNLRLFRDVKENNKEETNIEQNRAGFNPAHFCYSYKAISISGNPNIFL